MVLWGIFISFINAFLIGFSGAMMPGPMLGVTIDGSIKKGFVAGPLTVLGHAILELILVITMAFGLKDFFANPVVSGLIGVFGGAFLGWTGYGMVKSGIKNTVSINSQQKGNVIGNNLVLAGIIVSISNPYFFIWWASTGMESIRRAYTMGLTGVVFFYFGHILSDFVWYSIVAAAFASGKKLINDTVYRWLMILLGFFISGFSIYFIISGLGMLI
ncbi:MAG TPA: LysE family transporter [Clostridiaceae bacterium]|nr:LysE family transporter [Clostridiaceae bacterium]